MELLLAKVWYFFYFGGLVCIWPYINLLYRQNGLNDAQIGILAAVKPWVSASASFVWSGIADRYNIHKTILIATFVVSTLVRSSVSVLHSFAAFLVIAVLGEAIAAPCGVMADASVVASCKKDTDYGKARLWGAVGWGGLSSVAGWVVSGYGTAIGFAAYVLLSVPCVVCATRMGFDKLGQQQQEEPDQEQGRELQQQQQQKAIKGHQQKAEQLHAVELEVCCQQQQQQWQQRQNVLDQAVEDTSDVEQQHLLADPSMVPAVGAAQSLQQGCCELQQRTRATAADSSRSCGVGDLAVSVQSTLGVAAEPHRGTPGGAQHGSDNDMKPQPDQQDLTEPAHRRQQQQQQQQQSSSMQQQQQQQQWSIPEHQQQPKQQHKQQHSPAEQQQQQQQQDFWLSLRRAITSPAVLIFLCQALIMGFGIGVIDSFLFLFLQDLGGSEALMGLTLSVTCLAEVPVFHFQGKILTVISVDTMLHIVLWAYTVRLGLYALLPVVASSAWAVLPVELLHGVTFACGWGAGTINCKRLAPPGLAATMQGIFQGLYFGVGQGLGGLLGGLLKRRFGGQVMFGLCSGICLVGWLMCTAAQQAVTYFVGARGEEAPSSSSSTAGGCSGDQSVMQQLPAQLEPTLWRLQALFVELRKWVAGAFMDSSSSSSSGDLAGGRSADRRHQQWKLRYAELASKDSGPDLSGQLPEVQQGHRQQLCAS